MTARRSPFWLASRMVPTAVTIPVNMAGVVTAPRALAKRAGSPDKTGMAGPASRSVPLTPDGRYIVVRGRLWRAANPHLPESERQRLVGALMDARRAVGAAKRTRDRTAEDAAHADVDAAKTALGERGPVWWDDGAPDWNRHLVKNTPYADWFAALPAGDRS